VDLVIFEMVHSVECPFTYEPLHVYELHPVEGDQAASVSGGSEP
jgi:hypothetical protein